MPAFGPCRRACGCAGLFFCRRTPLSCLSSPHRSLPRLSSRLPFFSCRPAFPTARVSLCPCLPLPVFLSARVSLCPCFSLPVSPSVRVSLSPQLPSFVGSSSVVCIPSGFSSVISCFSVHRPSLAACCPSPVAPSIVQRLPLVVHRSLRRSSSIACRLLSVARCAVHRPALAACCPSLVAPFIVHRPPLVVRRPLSIPCCPLSIPCRPLSVVRRPLSILCRPLFIACCVARTPSPLSVPRRRAAPLSAAVRSGSRLLYPRNPGLRVFGSCLPCRSAAGSVGRSFRKNASALRTLVAAPFLTK